VSSAEPVPSANLEVEARRQHETATVALRGELDLASVGTVADALVGLTTSADAVRHIVLDLRGLSFIDVPGLRELIRQNDCARANGQDLTVVRGTRTVNRALELSRVGEHLVLVDDDPVDALASAT
jgi:anti-anti-sigma factor